MSRIYSRDGRGTLLYTRYENTSRSVNVRETRERVERVVSPAYTLCEGETSHFFLDIPHL